MLADMTDDQPKRGRPSDYSFQVAISICARLAEGKSLWISSQSQPCECNAVRLRSGHLNARTVRKRQPVNSYRQSKNNTDGRLATALPMGALAAPRASGEKQPGRSDLGDDPRLLLRAPSATPIAPGKHLQPASRL